MILIGSRALQLRAPSALRREPLDFDLAGTELECERWVSENASKFDVTRDHRMGRKRTLEGSTIVELEISAPGTSTELLLQLVHDDRETIDTTFGQVPSLDMLFTLKRSHRYLKDNPHFWKSLIDYHTMRAMGAKVRSEYELFLKLREQEQYLTLHPRLNQNKQQFFSDDSIQYVYDHDTIHESVAIFDRPAYQYYKRDGAEVQVSRKKFEAADRSIQLAGVVEEAAVLAIERSLVPHPGVKTPHEAWGVALSKVLTSITSGWFREFGYENAPEILKLYPKGYWEKFQQDVKNGLVKPYGGL
jgi:hypothetical protein